jgi:hypothetical protein
MPFAPLWPSTVACHTKLAVIILGDGFTNQTARMITPLVTNTLG